MNASRWKWNSPKHIYTYSQMYGEGYEDMRKVDRINDFMSLYVLSKINSRIVINKFLFIAVSTSRWKAIGSHCIFLCTSRAQGF